MKLISVVFWHKYGEKNRFQTIVAGNNDILFQMSFSEQSNNKL